MADEKFLKDELKGFVPTPTAADIVTAATGKTIGREERRCSRRFFGSLK